MRSKIPMVERLKRGIFFSSIKLAASENMYMEIRKRERGREKDTAVIEQNAESRQKDLIDPYRSEGNRLTKSLDKKPIEQFIFCQALSRFKTVPISIPVGPITPLDSFAISHHSNLLNYSKDSVFELKLSKWKFLMLDEYGKLEKIMNRYRAHAHTHTYVHLTVDARRSSQTRSPQKPSPFFPTFLITRPVPLFSLSSRAHLPLFCQQNEFPFECVRLMRPILRRLSFPKLHRFERGLFEN